MSTRRMVHLSWMGRATSQTAANTNILTTTCQNTDGSFLISANVLVNTATLHNFTVQLTYTDEGNTARTLTLPFVSLAGATLTAITNAGGAVPYEGVPVHIRVKANTNIVAKTVGTFTTVNYHVDIAMTQIV